MDALDITSLTAMVFSVTELFKRTGLDTKWSPLVALVSAIALSFMVFPGASVGSIIFAAIMSAASAMGTYSGVKALAK